MGVNPGVDVRIGWDESEQKEFLKALKQPLMVQTPLQLVIENLFQRLQAQATFIQQMKEKMERIAVKDVTADELLERIKMLESKQGDAAGPALNPFNQQDIISRLEALESKVDAEGGTLGDLSPRDRPGPPLAAGAAAAAASAAPTGAAIGSPFAEQATDLDVRLQRLEKRLNGVYNLNGKLVAVEQIAAGLGVAIPDLEYPTGGGPPQPQAGAVPPVQLNTWRPPQPPQPHPEARPTGAEPAAPAGGEAWPVGFKGLSRSASPVASGNGIVDLSAGLSGATAAAAGPLAGPRGTSPTSHSPRGLGSPSSFTRGSAMGSPSANLGAGAGAGAGAGVSSQKIVQLGQEVASVRADNEALKESLESLTQQVAALRAGLSTNAVESLRRLQQVEENVGALKTQVADLAAARRDAAARSGSEVTFADFMMLKSQVEASVADAKGAASAASTVAEKELPALIARVDEMAEGLKKKSEPRDIDALFHERINALESSMGEMKTELLGSIEAAMESAVKLDDLQALEELLEAKAPAEGLRAVQQQTHALGQAVASISEAMSLRPELGDSLRAAAAGAGAGAMAVATKMRCLTCDQPIRQMLPPPLGGGGAGGGMAISTGRGSFLPKLEAMPGKDGLPGGPGLMVAELRASREERLAGIQGVGTTARTALKAGELDDYANGGGGPSPPRDASPGRAVERSRAARVPVGVGSKASGPVLAGKPVFL